MIGGTWEGLGVFFGCRGVKMRFGGLTAVDDVSISANPGHILGIVGPNGAGKTTLFNILSGALSPQAGEVFLEDHDITKLKPSSRCHAGVVRTFQVERPFRSLTVRENVAIAATGQGLALSAAFKRADQVLERTELKAVANHHAGILPSGMQRRLEYARAIATRPRVLLLDEVMAGLTPSEVGFLGGLISAEASEGHLCVVLIEHVLAAVRNLCDHVIAMNEGAVIASGSAADVLSHEAVVVAYMGREPS